jgi:hypothetical protein
MGVGATVAAGDSSIGCASGDISINDSGDDAGTTATTTSVGNVNCVGAIDAESGDEVEVEEVGEGEGKDEGEGEGEGEGEEEEEEEEEDGTAVDAVADIVVAAVDSVDVVFDSAPFSSIERYCCSCDFKCFTNSCKCAMHVSQTFSLLSLSVAIVNSSIRRRSLICATKRHSMTS